ncbi:hypothetical protein T552_03308 [Pneumocystis carinii B80]|uniref:P-loop containing nucleoside triphosphate hydrolase protein n=1 Tax=Pneumocystis carinii (strain B80) TaxID=1408658 RepID=A0A0W4ZBB3_PNEC8|nr:hypothetical protein T552_03308 [Pneumocystis carinii B80]KTW25696.1 hypothetical protein T552_03308 [Pneumocystis carinii B80]
MKINTITDTIHYTFPWLIFTLYIVASIVPEKHNRQKSSISSLLQTISTFLILLTFAGDSILILVYILVKQDWWIAQSSVFYTLSSIFSWSIIFINTIEIKRQISIKLNTLIIYIFQTLADTILIFSILSKPFISKWEVSYSIIALSRILISMFFFTLYFLIKQKKLLASLENEPLLEQDQIYKDDELLDIKEKGILNAKKLENTWWNYIKKFYLFFPYLWPKDILFLQIIIFICFILLIVSRYINILAPQQLGIVTDKLISDADKKKNIWISIFLFMFYRFLQGNMGLLGSIRSSLWIPINQHAYRTLSAKAFEHIHTLSLDFHLSKKTGEIITALDHGSSINTFFEMVIFQVLPVIIDIFVAIIYFFIKFDAYFTLNVIIMTISYIYVTIKITEWRTGYRRDMVNKHREEYSIKSDSITNYETVKYFNAELFEFNRHENAIKTYQKAEFKVLSSLNLLNVVQNIIYTAGLLSITSLSAYKVIKNLTSVGDFVSLLTYMTQLQGPLNYFGSLYRSIQSSLVDAERMLELFSEESAVSDNPDAIDIKITQGEVMFDNVNFSYNKRKNALNALSFHAKPGASIALVGESGSGKTTIFRCLFKFFNIDSGTITIDGQNIHNVKLNSLRKNIGIVPQDTVLFNDTIMFNIRYAKPDASDEEVFEAARMAQIHDKIITWPEKYNTKVGERGLRLSGGEKQRIAIARTILKNPKIILLDEATSALDTHTERQVQLALKKLTQGRTTICIAHRLSTITSCDLILCMKDGHIVESGTHNELLAKGEETEEKGLYYSMWQKQIHANENSNNNNEKL